MRKFGRITHFLLTAALLVCLVPIAAFSADMAEKLPDAIGEVVYMMGSVSARQPDGTIRKLGLKKEVIPRDVIMTGARSNVEIIFKDKSVFSQGADSSTSLDEFVYSDDPSASKMLLKMGAGTFRYVTGKIVKQNPDAFALQTPTTTIGIRGTEVFAESTPEKEEVGVLDMTPGHAVDVSAVNDKKTITQAGYSVKATPDGRLSDPAPTDPATRARVMKAAPQTTQGEVGATPQDEKDLESRVDAFAAIIDLTKKDLGTINDHPDYDSLHSIVLQKVGHTHAESDLEQNTDSGLGGEGDGGGGGGGGNH